MNINVCVTRLAGYLSIKVDGDYSLSTGQAIIDRVLAESLKNKQDKILLDLRDLNGSIPGLDRYELGEYASSRWKQPLRVAIIGKAEEINKFFENVAVNRFVRTFVVTDFHAALDWLAGKSFEKADTDRQIRDVTG
jgi:hypothetical protein